MSLNNLNDVEGVEDEQDRVAGNNTPLVSNIYDMNITMMYADESKGGATSVTVIGETANGERIKETLWVTSGRAKGGKPYYLDRNNKKQFLPGYLIANAITLFLTGKKLGNALHEPKMVNIYDFEAKKEIPQTREVYTGVTSSTKLVALGIQQIIDDKKQDVSGEGEAADWQPTGITFLKNEIKKVFHAENHLTVQEVQAKMTDPAFYDKWLKSSKDSVYDASIDKKGLVTTLPEGGAAASTSNAAASSAAAASEDEDLFT